MEFYHATRWNTLVELLNGKSLCPGDLSNEDLKQANLESLNRAGLRCVWVSSQAWTNGNRFGAHVLRYQFDELAFPKLLSLGEHNGAKCFLSAPPMLADWLSAALNLQAVPREIVVQSRTNNSDRVDLLLPWNVPLSDKIYIAIGKTGDAHEDDPKFSKARLVAYLLLHPNLKFSSLALSDSTPAECASNLFWQLVGFGREGKDSDNVPATAGQILREALEHLVAKRVDAARAAMKRIGGHVVGAEELATTLNSICAWNVTAEQIIDS